MTDDQTANTRPDEDAVGSYVHKFDDLYNALDELLDEINAVDESIENEPIIARELAKAKKAVAHARRRRMLDLSGVGGEA